MPTECNTDWFGFARVEGRDVVAAFDGGAITSDAGALLLGSTNRAIKLIDRFAGCFRDGRCQELVEHRVETLVGQRVLGIALGYEDLNDHDELRHDPVMAVLAGKLEAHRKDCAPVAGKSTLNRLELSRPEATRYHKIAHDAAAIEELLVDLFIETHKQPPEEIILDLDATDDPLHGRQEGRFFHGYYDCYCYLPLYVFCGDQLLAAKLRTANIDASAGAMEEIARIVGQVRKPWPDVGILLRADSGFAREAVMAWCEANGVDYIFGLAKNKRLARAIAAELIQAKKESKTSGNPARRFKEFNWSTRKSWSRERRVIAKAEWTQDKANPRFIVTSLSQAKGDARHLYEKVYCARGEMENRTRNVSSICLPIVPRLPPSAPTSCACGSPRWPMSSSTACAGLPCREPILPKPPAQPSAASSSRSARSSPSVSAASSSRWRRGVLTRPSLPRHTALSPPSIRPEQATACHHRWCAIAMILPHASNYTQPV